MNFRCSHVGEDQCQVPATHVCTVAIGTWLCGVWLCPEHKKLFEQLLPDPALGVHVMSQVARSRLILPIDAVYNHLNDNTAPNQAAVVLACDKCDGPIIRRGGRWVHLDAATGYPMERPVNHEALPG